MLFKQVYYQYVVLRAELIATANCFIIIINPWCACTARSTVLGVCVCVCVCVCVYVCVWVHWWLSGIHSELPIKGLGVQGQPVVIWCSVFLLASVAAVTI